MRFDVLTLFPDIFPGYLSQSILNKAIERGLVEIHVHNMRDWAEGKHNKIDDTPYGGGPGMILMVEPVVKCVRDVQAMDSRSRDHRHADTSRPSAQAAAGRGIGRPQTNDRVVWTDTKVSTNASLIF